MQVSGASRQDIDAALDRANEQFDGNLQFNRGPDPVGRRFRLTLRVANSKGAGAKLGFSGRRTVSACWHAHGAFFDALPEDATIRAGEQMIHPGDPWVDRNIGSMMQPLFFREACDC